MDDNAELTNLIDIKLLFDKEIDVYSISDSNIGMSLYYPSFCIFTLVQNGSISLSINYKSYRLEKNALVFFSPISSVHVVDCSADFSASCLIVDIDFMREMFIVNNLNRSIWLNIQKSQQPFTLLADSESRSIAQHILRLKKSSRSTHAHKRQLLQFQLSELLLDISDIRLNHINPEKTMSRKETIFHSFIELVSVNYIIHKDLQFYASSLNMSTTYLSRVIKEISKQTATFFINQMTLLQAYKLLLVPENSIQQIAYDLEFADQATFSKFFKRMIKITPSEFRVKNGV